MGVFPGHGVGTAFVLQVPDTKGVTGSLHEFPDHRGSMGEAHICFLGFFFPFFIWRCT